MLCLAWAAAFWGACRGPAALLSRAEPGWLEKTPTEFEGIRKETGSRGYDSPGALWRPQATLLSDRGHRKGPRPQRPLDRGGRYLQSAHQPGDGRSETRARGLLARRGRPAFAHRGKAGQEESGSRRRLG